MSGGHYNYKYFQLNELADDIERDFLNDGKYKDVDWPVTAMQTEKEYDRLGDATKKERAIILKEIHSLIEDLRKCSIRAKELEWYISGDTGATSYLQRLKEAGLIE